jgi:hypothetical protein
MPIIPLNKKYRLASNFRSWELQKKSSRKHRRTGLPSEEWGAIRWYSTLDSALKDATEVCLRISKAEEVGEAIREVKELLAGIRQSIASELNGKRREEL